MSQRDIFFETEDVKPTIDDAKPFEIKDGKAVITAGVSESINWRLKKTYDLLWENGDRVIRDSWKEEVVPIFCDPGVELDKYDIAGLFKVANQKIIPDNNLLTIHISPRKEVQDPESKDLIRFKNIYDKEPTINESDREVYIKHRSDIIDDLLPVLQVEEIVSYYNTYRAYNRYGIHVQLPVDFVPVIERRSKAIYTDGIFSYVDLHTIKQVTLPDLNTPHIAIGGCYISAAKLKRTRLDFSSKNSSCYGSEAKRFLTEAWKVLKNECHYIESSGPVYKYQNRQFSANTRPGTVYWDYGIERFAINNYVAFDTGRRDIFKRGGDKNLKNRISFLPK